MTNNSSGPIDRQGTDKSKTMKTDSLMTEQIRLMADYWDNLPIKIERETIETADKILRQCVDADILNGRSYTVMIAASLLLSCKKTKTPVLAEELAQEAPKSERKKLNAQKIQTQSQTIKRELGLVTTPISPEKFLHRFMNEYKLTETQQKLCKNLLEQAEAELSSSIRPSILAASVLDAARRVLIIDITQKSISEMSHASPEQISEHSREINKLYSQANG